MRRCFSRSVFVVCSMLFGFCRVAFAVGMPELLVDLSTTGVSSEPGPKVVLNGEAYFAAAVDGTYGTELWKTDGTVSPSYPPPICDYKEYSYKKVDLSAANGDNPE